jgi:hypothetical protein
MEQLNRFCREVRATFPERASADCRIAPMRVL